MRKIIDEIVNMGVAPTRADIARLLTAIAPPGKKQKTKENAVRQLFEVTGGGTNFQGHHVADDLTTFGEY